MNESTQKELERLHHEYVSDVTMKPETLYDIALRIPAIKAKWVRQLWQHEYECKELERKLADLSKKQTILVRGKLKIDASDAQISKLKLKTEADIDNVSLRISELIFIIGYLKKYVNLVTYLGNDAKNALDATKLEVM